MVAPICTLGPSRPSARPEPIASRPPTNFTGMQAERRRRQLPAQHRLDVGDAAAGGVRREAAHQPGATSAAAAAQAATTAARPARPISWAAPIARSRQRSACDERKTKERADQSRDRAHQRRQQREHEEAAGRLGGLVRAVRLARHDPPFNDARRYAR